MPQEKIKVLIADDHRVVREGLSAIMRQNEDLEVVGEAQDGQEAVEKARREAQANPKDGGAAGRFGMVLHAHEQWGAAKNGTASVDIYALGATLHFLLAGEPPFNATTIPEMFAKITMELPPHLRTIRADVPADVEALVLSCLARTPAERPPDILAVSDALLPFAPARKQAALSVVGRAFGRPSTPNPAPAENDARATKPVAAAVSTAGPMTSTNDLAVSVRSSADEVVRPKRGVALFALIGVAVLACVVVVVAVVAATGSDRGGESPQAASSEAGVIVPVATPDALVVSDAEVIARPLDATRPDAGVVVRPDAGKRNAARAVIDGGIPNTPAKLIDAAVPLQTPIDAAPRATPRDAPCRSDDFQCKFGS